MLPLLSLLSSALPLVAASSPAEPCALVTEQIRKAQKADSAASSIFVPAQLAEDCLNSMPFYPDPAGGFLDELEKYVQWQSTIDVLKNPPDTYLSDSVDILGGFDIIRDTKFSSQWEFDQAIKTLIRSANDGHFTVKLCSFTPFRFFRSDLALVSVSKDGLQAPELYTYADAQLLSNAVVKVSPVCSINGQDPSTYLKGIADIQGSQDPDARYNALFYSPPSTDLFGAFHEELNYQGSEVTTLGFRNGSTATYENVAKVVDAKFDALNGEDIYNLYCKPKPAPDTTESAPSGPTTKEPLKTGPTSYPEPFIRDPWSQMNGYYLDDDTVVMYVPSFDGSELPGNHSLIFSNYASEIVNKALESGRTKLIIDVSGNGGGNIDRAFNLFKLFFPSEFPYSGTRFRRHDAVEGVVQALSAANFSVASSNAPLAYALEVTPDQESEIESYEKFLGDAMELGAKVSSLFANFNYTFLSSLESNVAPIRGYGGRPLEAQPFKPEDILIIGDGVCASTCTTFVNLMTNVGGVRTLALGGQPDGKPMQIMGGVRGSQSQAFSGIANYVSSAQMIYLEALEELDSVDEKEIERFIEAAPVPLDSFPISFGGGNVNLRNAYQEGEDHLPLQFQYQAGDCRLYYTAENIFKPETTWKSAKEAIWGHGSCIEGSTGGLGSLEDKKDKRKV